MSGKKNVKEIINMCIKQEAMLQFTHFSKADALELGMLLVAYAKEKEYAVAIDITVNGYQIFRYGFEGTNIHNDSWIKRKINTVRTLNISSYHVHWILENTGEKMGDDWHLDPSEYSCFGGGFPITIQGVGVIGSICVSGRPHHEDHQMIVDVLSKYLQKEVV